MFLEGKGSSGEEEPVVGGWAPVLSRRGQQYNTRTEQQTRDNTIVTDRVSVLSWISCCFHPNTAAGKCLGQTHYIPFTQ